MSHSETAIEIKTEPPTGSSKRKRKQSIKRNIVSDVKSENQDYLKCSKVDKTYGKRAKGDKGRSAKQSNEDVSNCDKDTNKDLCPVIVKSEAIDDEESSSKLNTNFKEECVTDSCLDGTQCNSTKQQCQNCKFCSEHVLPKKEPVEPKEKVTKSKKKFTCEICAKDGTQRVYSLQEKYKNHMATVHEIYGEDFKKFVCADCPGTVWFPSKSKFIYHLATKHPGVIKFVCEICTETFKLKANYKIHLKTHNVVVTKNFSCDVCNGTFVNKAGYEAHKKRFPGPHIKQSCAHCGFTFSREKHMKNHRCKTLLLEEAARAKTARQLQESGKSQEAIDPLKITEPSELKTVEESQPLKLETITTEDPLQKKTTSDGDSQAKRVVFHRVVPRRNQDQAVYRPVQNVSDSVVVQELREIDFEGGTFIAASASEPDQQFLVRDINGHLVQGNQILQLDINDVQPGEESQVYLADWNIVAPYVIREKSP